VNSDLYTVVTRVTPVREGGRTIVHAYGPYTKDKAKRIQQDLKMDAVLGGYSNRSEVSCCKLIDVDKMNREAALRKDAEG
jgi:hypothetical protein